MEIVWEFMNKWLWIYGDVYRQILFEKYPAELLCYCSRILFFAEAVRLWEAKTEAGTHR